MPVVFATPLQPLIDVFESVLVFIHDNAGFGWGFSIIVLTLIVRALLIPLTLRQFHSMQAMARLQPQIKALQAKYKDDKQRLNQEMMKFYQENKVNPFGSCLPLVAQLPVFFSLFYMLRKDLRHDICPNINPAHVSNPKPCGSGVQAAHFLGIPDITSQATGGVLIVLIILYVGSQLASGLLMSTAATDRNQRLIMMGLPIVFVAFVINFPAGLLVYWITTNLWTIVQQYIVKKRVGPIRPVGAEAAVAGTAGAAAVVAPPDKNGAAKGGGGLFGALAQRVAAGSASNGEPAATPEPAATRAAGPPPPSARKKKKRSGRRR
jgi:YidC/Oxa1 family membrane protein insertase